MIGERERKKTESERKRKMNDRGEVRGEATERGIESRWVGGFYFDDGIVQKFANKLMNKNDSEVRIEY